jgi:hypothetical protein
MLRQQRFDLGLELRYFGLNLTSRASQSLQQGVCLGRERLPFLAEVPLEVFAVLECKGGVWC